MPIYIVRYKTTMLYETEVEAISHDEAREIVEDQFGMDKAYDMDTEVTDVYLYEENN